MLITRYLAKHEYIRTYRLFKEAFGDDTEFMAKLYGGMDGVGHCNGSISSHSILVTEDEYGNILSMAQLKSVTAVMPDGEADVTYIFGVATRADHRREGLMDHLLSKIEAELRYRGEPFCFLVPVDGSVYLRRGYTHRWSFDESERDFLSADEGLRECAAKVLNGESFTAPLSLRAGANEPPPSTEKAQTLSIPVTRSSLPPINEYMDEIRDLWDSRWLTNMGEKHESFAEELSRYLDVPFVTLFTNGHLALEAALEAFDLPKGGEVITTPFTFASTTHAIVRKGLTPVFCDIRPDDFTMDARLIEPLISERTVAILPVHVYGHIADVRAIDDIAKRHGLKVLYDGAHAFGEQLDGVNVARYGDITMFSFHATKVFHTIEGGALCYHDSALKELLDDIKDYGFRGQESVVYPGGNAKMSEFQAAMGICNLRHLKSEIIKRKAAVDRYLVRLRGIDGIVLSGGDSLVNSNCAYFPVVFDGFRFSRDEVQAILKEHGIFTRKYFYPLTSEFSCYHDRPGFDPALTPVAQYVSEHVLTLPLYADLTLTDVDRICDIILS